MNIPTWVDTKNRGSKRASARLRYVMNVLAAKHTGGGSMRALAEKVSLDHSTISLYIRRGSFSQSAAERVVKMLKTDEVTVDMLINPLDIGKQETPA